MGKLSELVPFMADILKVPKTSVAVIARHARAEGKISIKGRGPGGAEMTVTDCTNLLLATMCCQSGLGMSKNAGGIIDYYRHLEIYYPKDRTGISVFEDMHPKCDTRNFGTSIDGILEQYSNTTHDTSEPALSISISRSYASIKLFNIPGPSYEIRYFPDYSNEMYIDPEPFDTGLSIRVTVYESTLRLLALFT